MNELEQKQVSRQSSVPRNSQAAATEENAAPDSAMAGSWLDRPVLAALDWEKLLYIAFIIIAIASRFWDLGARVMSHDESLHTYFSYNLAIGKGFAHTPLMHGPFLFHITALSYFLFGASDFTSRIPPAVFGVILVALPYFFRRWLGRRGALMTSFALLISPSILFHARYIRQEEFILVWTVLSVLFVWRYLTTRHYGWLVGLSIVLAFHATDKSTSFLKVALFVIFLAPLVLLQLYAARRSLIDALKAAALAGLLGVLMLLSGVVFVLISQFLANRLGIGTLVAQLNPLTLNIDARALLYAATMIVIAALACLGISLLLVTRFGAWFRFTSATAPAFNILVVLVTTTMFMASPSILLALNPLWRIATGADLVPIKLLGEMSNLVGNSNVISTMFALSLALITISVAIGMAWNWRRWLPIAGVFLTITVTLFTTVYTNAAGIGTGFVGQLGYWMAQQDVKRGSQPPYYYFLLVPLYEYMLVVGSLCAAVYIAYRVGVLLTDRRRETGSGPAAEPLESTGTAAPGDAGNTAWSSSFARADLFGHPIMSALLNPDKLFPLFLLWWTTATWVIYTLAGEKMPWLTVHFALPMALLTGWFLNRVSTPQEGDTGGHPAPIDRRKLLTLGVLSIVVVLLSVRVISLVANLNIQPGATNELLRWVAALIITCAGIVVAVIYLRRASRHYAGRSIILAGFAFLSVLTIRTAFMVTYINYDYTREFLFYAHGAPGTKIAVSQLKDLSKRINGDLSLHIGYDGDVSWPMSWYMREFPNARYFSDALPSDYTGFDAIMIGDQNSKRAEIEQKLQGNYTGYSYMLIWWPMQDYFDLTWDRISYSLFNPDARAALWDIIFNRDFTRYSQVFNKTSLTPDTWSPGHRFTLYIRNDVAAKVWNYRTGAVATGGSGVISSTLHLVGPANMAFAPNGERYVVDHKSNQVVSLDTNGNIISAFGGFGSEAGKFNDPWGIAVDAEGNIYVADTFNHRIQKFDANGNFLYAWGTPGVSSAPGIGRSTIFFGPRAIVLDPQGRLLVSDTGNKRIQVFSTDGNFITQFGSSGTGDGQFSEPVGLAVDQAGNTYVADTWNKRIQVFDPSYKFLRSWPVQAWQDMDQNNLHSVDHKPFLAISGDTLFVSSPMTHQVLGYTLNGKPVSLPGVNLPSDSLPTGLTVHNAKLYVTNSAGGTILEFPLSGK